MLNDLLTEQTIKLHQTADTWQEAFRLLAEAGNEIYIIGTSGLFGLHKELDTAWERMKQIFAKETASIESR
ncbi:beta/alpha barrel domain-containing protein [Bacillus safensis]|uniref:hypothetical protein n=1 Tax=Bacillus safensis TaxID=561879 RepID=UPI001E370063|nr:hypothetical protein [Bacillus safensis]UDB47895.1 hypothetical protein B0X07_01620 [Bacillus safensis]